MNESQFGGELEDYFEGIKMSIRYLTSELEDLEFFSDKETPRIIKQAQTEHYDYNNSIKKSEMYVDNIVTNLRKIKNLMSKPTALRKGNRFSRRD